MEKHKNNSILSKGFNWIANHTYRQIPIIFTSYTIKNTSSQYLSFQDYIKSPQIARQAGLMCIRQMRRDLIKRKQGIQKVTTQFKGKSQIISQKPHEFTCPICLQMMNGPITTSCSHTFCHMCLDEAILFSPSCPVCRNQIRGEQFVVSKSVQKIIIMFLSKFQSEEIQKFAKKQQDYDSWIKSRSLKKQQINIGDAIDVRDTEFIWCKATILDIFPNDCVSKCDREAILVHYEGWANVFNEVISLDSQRLSMCQFYTGRIQIPHYNLSTENREHLRSPVIIGEPYIVPQIQLSRSQQSFEFIQRNNLELNSISNSSLQLIQQSNYTGSVRLPSESSMIIGQNSLRIQPNRSNHINNNNNRFDEIDNNSRDLRWEYSRQQQLIQNNSSIIINGLRYLSENNNNQSTNSFGIQIQQNTISNYNHLFNTSLPLQNLLQNYHRINQTNLLLQFNTLQQKLYQQQQEQERGQLQQQQQQYNLLEQQQYFMGINNLVNSLQRYSKKNIQLKNNKINNKLNNQLLNNKLNNKSLNNKLNNKSNNTSNQTNNKDQKIYNNQIYHQPFIVDIQQIKYISNNNKQLQTYFKSQQNSNYQTQQNMNNEAQEYQIQLYNNIVSSKQLQNQNIDSFKNYKNQHYNPQIQQQQSKQHISNKQQKQYPAFSIQQEISFSLNTKSNQFISQISNKQTLNNQFKLLSVSQSRIKQQQQQYNTQLIQQQII